MFRVREGKRRGPRTVPAISTALSAMQPYTSDPGPHTRRKKILRGVLLCAEDVVVVVRMMTKCA